MKLEKLEKPEDVEAVSRYFSELPATAQEGHPLFNLAKAYAKLAQRAKGRPFEWETLWGYLRIAARRAECARALMLSIDPLAKPDWIDADANGDPVRPGEKYRWYPGLDSRGNEPGFYYEAAVTKVEDNRAYAAAWQRIGTPNPGYQDCTEERPEEETFVFAKMLTPVLES